MDALLEKLDARLDLLILHEQGFCAVCIVQQDKHEFVPQCRELSIRLLTHISLQLSLTLSILNEDVSHGIGAQLTQLRKAFMSIIPLCCLLCYPLFSLRLGPKPISLGLQ